MRFHRHRCWSFIADAAMRAMDGYRRRSCVRPVRLHAAHPRCAPDAARTCAPQIQVRRPDLGIRFAGLDSTDSTVPGIHPGNPRKRFSLELTRTGNGNTLFLPGITVPPQDRIRIQASLNTSLAVSAYAPGTHARNLDGRGALDACEPQSAPARKPRRNICAARAHSCDSSCAWNSASVPQ